MKQSMQNATSVKTSESMSWTLIEGHVGLYHKEIVSASEADALGISMSSVLWERIDVGGAVLPHYHDVAEVIYILTGQVKLLCNNEWKSYKAGDTFHVPAGVIHSVRNDDIQPTEQISMFLPISHAFPPNHFFKTMKVDESGMLLEMSNGLRREEENGL